MPHSSADIGEKSFGFWRLWALAVGAMIGSGVFLLPASLAPYGGLGLLAWGVTGVGTLMLALTFGRLAQRIPKAGGPQVYTREAFGDLPGFLIAWSYWNCEWSTPATIIIAFVGYLAVFFPEVAATPQATAATALAGLWLFALINIRGVKGAGTLNFIMTVMKLLPLAVIVGVCLFFFDSKNFPVFNPTGDHPAQVLSTAAILTLWAFLGFETATVPAGHVKNPQRTIPRVLIVATISVAILYVLACVAIMGVLPPESLLNSKAPFADAAKAILGTPAAMLIGVGAIISALGATHAHVLVSSQVAKAAADEGMFPKLFGSVNRQNAPAAAILVNTVLGSLLILMNANQGLVGMFNAMLMISTFASLIPFAASAASELKLSMLAKENFLRLVTPALGLIYSCFALWGSGLHTLMWGGPLLALGLPVYMLLRRRKMASAAS